MRLTVTKKIGLSTAMMLLIGMVSMLIIYDGLTVVRAAMGRLAQVKEPANAAAYEMEIQVHDLGLSVLRYLDTGSPAARNDVSVAAARFETFHREYLRLIDSARGRELGRMLGEHYATWKAFAEALMSSRDGQEAIYATIARNFERIDQVIDHRIRPGSPGGPGLFGMVLTSEKVPAFLDLEAEIAEVGLWLANYQRVRKAEYRDLMFQKERSVRAAIRRLKTLGLTTAERRWARLIEQVFDETMAAIRRLLSQERDQEARVDEFVARRLAIDRILDGEVQVLTVRGLTAPTEEADRATAAVIGRIRILVPLFVVVAAVVALVLARGIVRPLQRLRRGTETIARGELSYRIPLTGRDEFTELGLAFNLMVAQLEATTVSKTLLETSERKLQATVARLSQEVVERARAQEEQVRLQASLRRAETMSAMGTLVAGVAHEVRNPLFGISSILDAMEARLGAHGEHTRYTPVLRAQVERLTGLMQELLDYGRPPSVEMAPGVVIEALDEAVLACGPLARQQDVEIVSRGQASAARVLMDRTRLPQVFKNIVENAIHHSPRRGRVTIETRIIENGGPWFECAVRDAGPGIRDEDLPRLFEPFFSRRRGGTGLGLSIVQRIVEEHGGRVTASNHPEGGAMMVVWLPLEKEAVCR
jgi:signal transduction histidine kinase